MPLTHLRKNRSNSKRVLKMIVNCCIVLHFCKWSTLIVCICFLRFQPPNSIPPIAPTLLKPCSSSKFPFFSFCFNRYYYSYYFSYEVCRFHNLYDANHSSCFSRWGWRVCRLLWRSDRLQYTLHKRNEIRRPGWLLLWRASILCAML